MSDERLVVKFEKGTGGPLRVAVGDLVPTYVAPIDAPQPPSDWFLMLANVVCDGEFDGVSRWYQIAYSSVITIRPYRQVS